MWILWLSDRCPGLTERSRFRCRAGFLMPLRIPVPPDPKNRVWDPQNSVRTPKMGGPPPLPPGSRKTTPKVLFSDPGPPNTSLRYPLKGKNGKKSVFDIEGFGALFWGVRTPQNRVPGTRG